MRKFLLAQFLLCLFAIPLLAQDIAVSGKFISGEDRSFLPGVNVQIKETARGTSRDASGAFQINAPSGPTLVFSFIGFSTQEVAIDNCTNVSVTLAPDASQL